MTDEKLEQINKLKSRIEQLKSIIISIRNTNRSGGRQLILASRYIGPAQHFMGKMIEDYRFIAKVDEELKTMILNYYDEKLKKLEKEFESL